MSLAIVLAQSFVFTRFFAIASRVSENPRTLLSLVNGTEKTPAEKKITEEITLRKKITLNHKDKSREKRREKLKAYVNLLYLVNYITSEFDD